MVQERKGRWQAPPESKKTKLCNNIVLNHNSYFYSICSIRNYLQAYGFGAVRLMAYAASNPFWKSGIAWRREESVIRSRSLHWVARLICTGSVIWARSEESLLPEEYQIKYTRDCSHDEEHLYQSLIQRSQVIIQIVTIRRNT